MALTTSEKADRYDNEKAKKGATKKAMKARVAEGGTAAVAATGIGYLIAAKPDLATLGDGYLHPNVIATAGGLALMMLGKGTLQEVGSGLLFAGGVPLLNQLGGKIAESTAG